MRRPEQRYARQLARMSRKDRLLCKAIKRCELPPKPKYRRSTGDNRDYVVGTDDGKGQEQRSRFLPKEWR